MSIDVDLPGVDPSEELEIRLYSDRNKQISRFSDVSERNPDAARIPPTDRDHFFPVVDVDLADGWHGIARFDNFADGDFFYVNGQANAERLLIADEVAIDTELLQHWENSVFVHDPRIHMSGFCFEMTAGVGNTVSFVSLSPQWHGTLTVQRIGADEDRNLYTRRVDVDESASIAPRAPRGAESNPVPSTGELVKGLERLLTFMVGTINETPHSPVRGGFHLFYDMDARTYRVPHWVWTWGVVIKLLLEVSEHGDLIRPPGGASLVEIAKRAGRTTLGFIERDPAHPASGLITVRWNTRVDTERGFQQYLSSADTHFLVGWGWIPLYEATGDRAFLDAAKLATRAAARLVDQFGIPPMDYIVDDDEWKDFTLDEAGFTPEGLAEVYRITGDESAKQTAVDFMTHMISALESPNGIWYRRYDQKTGAASDPDYTRGLGWAMEGLLAMDRMIPNSIYLEKAMRIAETLLRYQLADGSWSGDMREPVSRIGITEKGTALWSYLLYATHRRNGDERYLNGARSALTWCIRNQENGDDPHALGGIPGVSNGSGVVFRRWFRLICLFTCAFAGLSILEELRLRNETRS